MSKCVRPRISEQIYELLKSAATSRCVAFGHWLVEAIIEKAAREGFEIVDGKVRSAKAKSTEEHFKIIDGTLFYSEAFVNEIKKDRLESVNKSSEES